MRNNLLLSSLAVALFGIAGGGNVLAQDEGERARDDVEADLDRARDEMEEAAREIGRLSAELAGPIANDVARQFRFAGQRAMLGLNIEDAEQGVRVVGVSPNGPAAAAGIEVGDVIVAIDGGELTGAREGGGAASPSELLLTQMQHVEPGEDVVVRIARDGTERDLTVQTRELQPWQLFNGPQSFSWSGRNPWRGFYRSNAWTDMQLVTLTPGLGTYFGTETGILVVRGPENDALALRDGDVILDVGGRVPTTPEHAIRILGSFESGEALRITIMRQQRRQTLELTMPADRGR